MGGHLVRLGSHRQIYVPLGQGCDKQVLCPGRVVKICLEEEEAWHINLFAWPPPASPSPLRAFLPGAPSFLLPSSGSRPRRWYTQRGPPVRVVPPASSAGLRRPEFFPRCLRPPLGERLCPRSSSAGERTLCSPAGDSRGGPSPHIVGTWVP